MEAKGFKSGSQIDTDSDIEHSGDEGGGNQAADRFDHDDTMFKPFCTEYN